MVAKNNVDPISRVRGKRFEIMAENFDDVFWMFNEDFSELLYVNDRAEEIYGISEEELKQNPLGFVEQIHPEDRDRVKQAMQDLMNGQRAKLEYRVNADEDYERWVDAQSVPIPDENGEIKMIIGAIREITESKKNQQKLETEKQRLEAIVSLQEAVAKSDLDLDAIMNTITDRVLELTNADGAAIELAEEDKLVPKAVNGILREEDSREISSSLSGDCYKHGDIQEFGNLDDASIQTVAENQAGSMLLIPLDYSGERFGVLKIVKEVADGFDRRDENVMNLLAGMLSASIFQAMQYMENEEYLEQMIEMAYTDTLTGLNNRRELMKQLENEIKRTERFPHPLTFGILDLDHFKLVNDEYGHLAGDKVLQDVADVFREQTREIDTAGRFGGEEFGFVLPETDLEDARVLCKRILEEIRNRTFRSDDGETIELTASIGLSTHQDGETRNELIGRADNCLYKAKRNGRDCLVAG